MLIAVTAVVGVFLSLYLTAISTVAGTTYARLPEQLRNSLVSERVGNVYVRYLIFLTILSLLLLAVAVLQDIRPQAGVLAVVVLTVIAVFAFAALSSRVFQFFDPTSLANTFLYDLDRWSNQATTSGYQWNDGAFQDYYRRRAHLALSGVAALVDIAHNIDDLKKEPLRRLISQVINFAALYIGKQEKIPSSSRWYDLVPQYKDWYLTSDQEVGLRSATMTSLQPEMKPDAHWLEKSLTDVVMTSMRACLSDGRIETGLDILAQVPGFFESEGAAWRIEDGFRLLDQIQLIVIPLVRSEPAKNGARPNLRDQLAAIELTAQIPIRMLLAFYARLRSYEFGTLADRIAKIKWSRQDQLYKMRLPATALERIEDVQRRLMFELDVEGGRVSANWYLTQLIFEPLAFSAYEQIEKLSTATRSYYLANSEALISAGRWAHAAILITNGLEFTNKFLRHLSTAEKFGQAIDKFRLEPKLRWPEWRWRQIEEALRSDQDELMRMLAKCTPKLGRMNLTEDLPDILGQAVHLLGEQCFECFLRRNVEQFRRLFPFYFQGTLVIRDRLVAKTADWQQAPAIHSSPLLDLVELSGFAKLFSELTGEPGFWEVCKQTWDAFLVGQDRSSVIAFWAAVISYNQQLFAIAPRAVLRTSWKMAFDRELRNLARNSLRGRGVGIAWLGHSMVDHASVLIQVFGGINDDFPSFYDGTDVFVEFFFKTLPESEVLDFGTRDDLGEAIARWERNREQEKSDDDDNGERPPDEGPDTGVSDSSAGESPDASVAE